MTPFTEVARESDSARLRRLVSEDTARGLSWSGRVFQGAHLFAVFRDARTGHHRIVHVQLEGGNKVITIE